MLATAVWGTGGAGTKPAAEILMNPLSTKIYDAAILGRDFAPEYQDRNKQLVFRIGTPQGTSFGGKVVYSRWGRIDLPKVVPEKEPTTEAKPDFFTYDVPAKGTVEWHLNFAHPDVFAFYSSGLLAQDELQTSEHPVLGSLRRALVAEKLSTLVVEGGKATPILVQGVERRVKLSTDVNANEGRPRGLYGNVFSGAGEEAVRKAAVRIDPPTVSNIIAIAAPAGGRGKYTEKQIRYILVTTVTAFKAARVASSTEKEPHRKVVIHTGFWGCGAFGGNRLLMTALQLLAGRLAEVDGVVYHTGDKAGLEQFKSAEKVLAEVMDGAADVETIITRLEKRGFAWGESDGN
jgi:hypothetical protein